MDEALMDALLGRRPWLTPRFWLLSLANAIGIIGTGGSDTSSDDGGVVASESNVSPIRSCRILYCPKSLPSSAKSGAAWGFILWLGWTLAPWNDTDARVECSENR